MPQIIVIFMINKKIFAININSVGKVETYSINGCSEIEFENEASIDELMSCIYRQMNINDFSDGNYSVVIIKDIEDRKTINYIEEKCKEAKTINIFELETILPRIALYNQKLNSGKEFVVEFLDKYYIVYSDDNGIIKVKKQNRRNIDADKKLTCKDFGCINDLLKMCFILFVSKNTFYLYQDNDDVIKKSFIAKTYNLYSIKEDVMSMLSILAKFNGSKDTSVIELIVIENIDEVRNKNVELILNKIIKKIVPLHQILNKCIKSLTVKRELHIKEFGVNYDGDSYLLKDETLQKIPYSLLSYSLKRDSLIEYL